MQVPLKLTFRHVQKTEDVVALIQKQVDKLHRFCPYLTSCRIAVERRNASPESGNQYRVRLDMSVPPSKDIIVARDPLDSEMHDDLRTAPAPPRGWEAAGRRRAVVRKRAGKAR
jgi:hypothetical protein